MNSYYNLSKYPILAFLPLSLSLPPSLSHSPLTQSLFIKYFFQKKWSSSKRHKEQEVNCEILVSRENVANSPRLALNQNHLSHSEETRQELLLLLALIFLLG